MDWILFLINLVIGLWNKRCCSVVFLFVDASRSTLRSASCSSGPLEVASSASGGLERVKTKCAGVVAKVENSRVAGRKDRAHVHRIFQAEMLREAKPPAAIENAAQP